MPSILKSVSRRWSWFWASEDLGPTAPASPPDPDRSLSLRDFFLSAGELPVAAGSQRRNASFLTWLFSRESLPSAAGATAGDERPPHPEK